MKKIYSVACLILVVLLFQNCKKSSNNNTPTTITPPPLLTANVNGSTWTPDTLSATITYNTALKTKVLSFTGTLKQERVTCSVTLKNATAANDFIIGDYPVDDKGNPQMVYSKQQKDGNGNYVFVPLATAAPNYGKVSVTAIDSAKGVITGTFSFTYTKTNYNSNGEVVSITNYAVTGGTFTDMPYTFVNK